MRRRAAGGCALAIAVALGACDGPAGGDGSRSAPRLCVLVSIDTLRADRLSCYGGSARTPAIDALAAAGRRFERAYTPCPLTGPAHASLFTGLEPPAHGVRDNGVPLPARVRTIAETLAERGWDTAAFVGAAPLDERLGFSRGFATYDRRFETRRGSPQFAERKAIEVAAAAARFLAARPDTTRPLFLFLHFFDPHAPYDPPPPFARAGGDRYDGEIESVDAALGEVFAVLRLRGLLGPSSLVILTSDHGESLGEHGEATHGLLLHDATLRVPLVAAGAAFPVGVATEPVSLLDVAPTIAEFADASPGARAPFPGRSLAEAGLAPSRELRAESYYAWFRYRWAGLRSIRSGAWKWIDGGPEKALYDLGSDPRETRDATSDRPEEARRLAEALDRVEREAVRNRPPEAPDWNSTGIDPEALGYVGRPASPRETLRLPPAGNDALPTVASHLPLLTRLEQAVKRLDAKDAAAAREIAAALCAEDPGNPDAALTLGRAEREIARTGGDYSAAIAALRRAVDLRPDSPGPRNALIQALSLAGGQSDALAAADAAVAADAADADTEALAGEVCLVPRSPVYDPERAKAHFRLALEKDPDHPVARERLRSLEGD